MFVLRIAVSREVKEMSAGRTFLHEPSPHRARLLV